MPERCPYDPSGLVGVPLGMFHCPECGEMVIAGLPHPDYESLGDEPMPELVFVGGSRHPTPKMKQACWRYLATLPQPETHVIHGGAIGIDTIAERASRLFGFETTVYHPDYTLHGNRAPLKRNQEMAEDCVRAVFFWDGESTGTWHAINEVRKRGKPLEVYVNDARVINPSHLQPPKCSHRRPRREVELL